MKYCKLFLSFFLLLFGFINLSAQTKSDSVDILNYTINLKIIDFNDDSIQANTIITFHPKINNMQSVAFDLLRFKIDSIFSINQKITNYNYNDTLLIITLPQALNSTDTSVLTIYYHGAPTLEAYGWGGLHLDPTIAYNLGVAFDANPHNFGRGWFPCIDDFVDRATYNFNITTKNPNTAVCNGLLTETTSINDSLTLFKWKLNQEIPTYLASVAISNYAIVKDTFNSINGAIPIAIYVKSADTAKTKSSFIHLKEVLQGYEKYWGPYRWDRIGYVSTPLGAMEHPTNIAMPSHTFTGDLTNEWLYYHELAHSWFGDQITCSTAGDMWINEGWATYNESFFNEILYGKVFYKNYMRAKHKAVLQKCHVDDGGYFSLTNLPLSITYGTTAYSKGSGVVHTLRNYMGDTLFFNGVKAFLNQYAFKPVSTNDLKNSLSNSSGIDLSDFFNAWVESPGFPHFSVDSFNIVPNGGNFSTTVYVRQKLNHSSTYANSNKIEITFKSANWQEHTETINFSGVTGVQTFQLPFNPILALIDKDEKIADATIESNMTIKTSGNINLTDASAKLNVSNCPDSSYIRVTHNFVAPDNQNPISGLFLSNYHYWKVEGIFANGFNSKLLLQYNATLFDSELITNVADSLVIVYRANTAANWELTHSTRIGASTVGQFTIDTLKNGEYSLAIWDYDHVSVFENNKINKTLELYPNPTNDELTIKHKMNKNSQIIISDVSGKTIKTTSIQQETELYKLSTVNFPQGIYFLSIKDGNNKISKGRFVKL
ncbi:MAG: M1 family aminopeptidase [Bacteroidota bacterium]